MPSGGVGGLFGALPRTAAGVAAVCNGREGSQPRDVTEAARTGARTLRAYAWTLGPVSSLTNEVCPSAFGRIEELADHFLFLSNTKIQTNQPN